MLNSVRPFRSQARTTLTLLAWLNVKELLLNSERFAVMFITVESLVLENVHSAFSAGEDDGSVNGKIRLLSPCVYCQLDSMSFPISTSAPEGPVVGNCF